MKKATKRFWVALGWGAAIVGATVAVWGLLRGTTRSTIAGLGAGPEKAGGRLPTAPPPHAVTARVGTRVGVLTMDAMLATCPAPAEIAEIRRVFNIDMHWGYRCVPGVSDSKNPMLALYNAFRAMKLLTFDAPIPGLGYTNVWAWLASLNLRYTMSPDPTVHAHAGGFGNENVITLPQIALFTPPYSHWTSPGLGWSVPMAFEGIVDLIGIIIHEARHTSNGGGYTHHCTTAATPEADCSLEEGGAYGVEYYWYLWCAQHSGELLTDREKTNAMRSAQAVLQFIASPPRGTVAVRSR